MTGRRKASDRNGKAFGSCIVTSAEMQKARTWFAVERFAKILLRNRLNKPVYLCGSALRRDNLKPRDWDVRVCLTDKEFAVRYGISARQWSREGKSGQWTEGRHAWSDHCTEASRAISELAGVTVDVQIYPASFWKTFAGKPRFRIA